MEEEFSAHLRGFNVVARPLLVSDISTDYLKTVNSIRYMAGTRHAPKSLNRIQQRLYLNDEKTKGVSQFLISINSEPIGIASFRRESHSVLGAGFLLFVSQSKQGKGRLIVEMGVLLALARFPGKVLRIGTLNINKPMIRIMMKLHAKGMRKFALRRTREVILPLRCQDFSNPLGQIVQNTRKAGY
jgi:hypothetical protein